MVNSLVRDLNLKLIKSTLRIISISVLYASAVLAEPKLHLEVTPQSGDLSDAYMFSVVVEGESETSYPFLVGGDDFRLSLIGPETSVEVINGTVNKRVSYRYQLLPKKSGELETPSADIEIDGKQYKAAALKVTVSESGKPSLDSSEAVFIRQDLPTTEVYVGQQLPYALELYTSVPIYDPQLKSLSFDGFWNEEVGQDSNLSRVINGKRYSLTAIRKALFPLRAGEIVLPVQKVRLQVRESGRHANPFDFQRLDPFDNGLLDDFFGRGHLRDMELATDALPVHVKQLPSAPDGAESWGTLLVGKSSLELKFDSSAIKVGESKTAKLTLSSFGNTNSIKKLPIPEGSDFKAYQESPNTERHKEAGKIRFEKTFSFSIVPLKPGEFELAPFTLTFFDPETSQYKTATTASIRFSVTGEALPTKSASAERKPESASPSEKRPSSASEFPKENQPAFLEKLGISQGTGALLIFVAGGVLALLIIFLKLLAGSLPIRRLRRRVKLASTVRELQSAFGDYLGLRYGLGPELSLDEVRLQLTNRNAVPALIFEIISIRDQLNAGLYTAGKTTDTAEMRRRILALMVSQ